MLRRTATSNEWFAKCWITNPAERGNERYVEVQDANDEKRDCLSLNNFLNLHIKLVFSTIYFSLKTYVMNEITLQIPNSKLDFFLELVKNLGLNVKSKQLDIPEEHQKIVLDRIMNTKEEELLVWKDVQNDFDGI